MKAAVSGTRDGVSWPAIGEEVDLPTVEAAAYCAMGMAEEVKDEPEGKPEIEAQPEEKAVPSDDTEKATPSRKGRASSS